MKKIITYFFFTVFYPLFFSQFLIAGSWNNSGTTDIGCQTVPIPYFATNIQFQLSMTGGDWDLYVRKTACPTLATYDCRPYLSGISTETCGLYSAGTTSCSGNENWYVWANPYTQAGTWTISVTWTDPVYAAPSTQASNITFSNVQSNQMNVAWTNGNGNKRVVIINTSNSFTNPPDGTDPAANAVYGGAGEQVVFNNSGSSFTVTGLSAGTTYWFRVYEYNCSGATTKYISSTAANNPNSQSTVTCISPTTQASAFTSSAITANSMTVGWTRGNGNNVLVVARSGSAVNADPTHGTGYTANAVFGSGDQIGAGNYVIYNGTGTSVNITGLSTYTTYYYAIYEYNTTGNCYALVELTGNATTLCTPPTVQASGFSASAIADASMTVSWTRGNGTGGVLVIAKAGSAPTDPTNGITYTANATYGSGSAVGGGFCVYKSTGTSVNLLCCIPNLSGTIFKKVLLLQCKFEEEASSAGEQLTSNRIYDGEYFHTAPSMGLFYLQKYSLS